MTPFQLRMRVHDLLVKTLPHTPPLVHLTEEQVMKVRAGMDLLYLEALSQCPVKIGDTKEDEKWT